MLPNPDTTTHSVLMPRYRALIVEGARSIFSVDFLSSRSLCHLMTASWAAELWAASLALTRPYEIYTIPEALEMPSYGSTIPMQASFACVEIAVVLKGIGGLGWADAPSLTASPHSRNMVDSSLRDTIGSLVSVSCVSADPLMLMTIY